jgi:L-fucose isomerase-like protein
MTLSRTKSTFALFFGNRGFFPGSLIAAARAEMSSVLQRLGHQVLLLDAGTTRHGAVETVAEGEQYAAFLHEQAGRFDGVILCLPNFGDENGATAALREAGVPILVQAYPDDLDKMAPELRRDAFCGKLSITDVFRQVGIKFTALQPHTTAPSSPAFAAQIDHFDRVCQVVKALRRMTLGQIGARVTPFKTVRIDELALQRHGIDVESFDLAEIIGRVQAMDCNAPACREKSEQLSGYTDFSAVPAKGFANLVKLAVVLDEIIAEARLDAIAIRCWLELQKQLGISPCVLLSELNNRGLCAACEVDLGNAVMMRALSKASGDVAACLDWNNNYGEQEDKCILFHCGPVPQALMRGKGKVTTHCILDNAPGVCQSHGCNTGRIRPMPMTFGSLMSEEGRLKCYLGQGSFTEDEVPENFFGCAGVARIERLQDVLEHVVRQGHRHHVSVTPDHVLAPLREALGYYLNYTITLPQGTNV